jgi:hypothetical protein
MPTKREIQEKEAFILSIDTPVYKVIGLDRDRNAHSSLKYYLIQVIHKLQLRHHWHTYFDCGKYRNK